MDASVGTRLHTLHFNWLWFLWWSLLKREVLLTWDEDFTSVGLRANVYRLFLGIMLVYSKVVIIDSPLLFVTSLA